MTKSVAMWRPPMARTTTTVPTHPASEARAQEPAKKLPIYDARAHGANCDACPLRGFPVVPPTIPDVEVPDAILVGQEPGGEEERKKIPFIGPSGRKVDKMLVKHGLDRSRMHITNSALCRMRRDEDRPLAIKCCAPRLQREIDSYPKSVPVIPMGAFAFKAVYGRKIGIGLARGFVWNKNDRDILPTIHPANVLYDQTQAPLFSRDFRRIAKRIHGELELEAPKGVTVPRTVEELRRVLAWFGPVVACDIETSKDQPTQATLLCIGISDVKHTVVVPWDLRFKLLLNEFFAKRTTIFHNGFAFDSIVLEKHGVIIPLDKLEDTLIAHHCYASHFPQRLDHLVSFYLDAEPWKIQFGKRSGDEKGLPKLLDNEEQLFKYNALDVFLTARLWQEMKVDLSGWQSLYAHDKELATLCREMQMNGVFVDQPLKNELSTAIKLKEERLYSEMKELNGGEDFAPTKAADIRRILFEKFGAPMLERTMKGLPSTNKKVLQALAAKDRPYGDFCKKLVTLRACSKMRVTYLDNLIIEADGRVRPGWRSFGTPTGRESCRKPNLQNLRRVEDKEPEQQIRKIYIAPPGHRLVGFDLSQVEPRVAAYIAGDEKMIKAIESGDFHTANAIILFGELPELMDPYEAKNGKGKNMRTLSKICGLAVNYLAGADKLFETIRADGRFPVKFGQVTAMLERLHRAYYQHFERVDHDVEFCRKHGYIKIGFMSGRVRWLGHAPSPSDCANSPIQAGAADVMNALLLRIWKHLKKVFGKSVRLTGQIHDAGIFEVPDALVDNVKNIIQEEADRPVLVNGYNVKFPIDLKDGLCWSEV